MEWSLVVTGAFLPALMLPAPDFIALVRQSLTGGTPGGLLPTIGRRILASARNPLTP
ncbi:MAG: hypothetical protein ACTSSQ_03170 [Alphaproteobacteria bacterium]